MFIQRTKTRNRASGEPYCTHRLVHSSRVGSVVKQTTLLNLGSHFDLPQDQWPALAARIDESVRGPTLLARCHAVRRSARPWRSAMPRS